MIRSTLHRTHVISRLPIVRYFSSSHESLNTIMKNTITQNGQNAQLLSNWDKSSSGYLPAVALIESIREGYWSKYNIESSLESLENATNSGNLSAWEQYFAAASLAWANGNFKLAAALLETIVHTNSDPYALSLAQEAYILSGSNENALGCVIRHPIAMNIPEELAPSIHGMIATGYNETGKVTESKEVAQRAIAMSKGKDIRPIHSLLNYFYLSGKSSELVSTADEHLGKLAHDAKIPLLAMNGSAYVMRGNCNGAFNTCSEILSPSTSLNVNTSSHARSTLTDCSMLLWHLMLNVEFRHAMPLDMILQPLGQGITTSMSTSPVFYLLKAIQLSGSAHSLYTLNRSDLVALKPEQPKKGFFRKKSSPAKKVSSTSSWGAWFSGKAQEEPIESIAVDTKDAETSSNVFTVAENANPFITGHKEEIHSVLRTYIEELNNLLENPLPEAVINPIKFPVLSSIQPSPSLKFVYHKETASIQRREQLVTTLQISKAIAHYGLQEYEECAKLLSLYYATEYKGLGMSAVHRDIIHQTFIESYIRSNDLPTAAALLCERTILLPNDGQTWKRLSKIYTSLGKSQLAVEAQYTAWQLGIGQGGFGGPI